ncbi:MAG: hypothetical protein ACRDT6_21365, partial [Micromonosporaceae bacterium]
MNTPSQHQPEGHDSWFRGIPRDGFPAPEQRQPGPWGDIDPLTGPLPPPEQELGAPLAEAETPPGAPEVSEGYPPPVHRQHAERVPRYAGPSLPPPVGARPDMSPQQPRLPDYAAPEQQGAPEPVPPAPGPERHAEFDPASYDQVSFDEASADELVERLRVEDAEVEPSGSARAVGEAAESEVDPVAAPDTATDVNTSALPTVSAPPGADATPTQRVPATGPSAG